jgi:hypothetical protein
MNNFLSAQLWFNQRPDILSSGSKIILISFIAFCFFSSIIAIILKLKKGFYGRFWEKLFYFFISNFFIGAALYFFCQQMIPLLSSRFWYLLWGAGMAVWISFIILYLKGLPAKKKELIKEREYKKYLP